jgi:hypothetical protein
MTTAAAVCVGFGLGVAVTSFTAVLAVWWSIHFFNQGGR